MTPESVPVLSTDRLLDRLMELWGEPWSEPAFGEAQMLLSRLRGALEAARRDRDLAIAHDSQPYPTAWAYEQVCRVRDELLAENERLRAAVAEGDRLREVLRERMHPTMDGYCPECGGGCLIGFATPTPARAALTSEAHRG